MLAGWKRKCKYSTGKALTPSAVRPMLAGRKEETEERKNECSTGKALTPFVVRPMLFSLPDEGLVSFFNVEPVGPDITLESIRGPSPKGLDLLLGEAFLGC